MKILLVCLGNICRSPMAEGILRDMIQRQGLDWTTDSAGTGDYHAGEAPDERAQRTMADRNIDISDLRARQIRPVDFHEFDLILTMDESNRKNTLSVAPDHMLANKVRAIMDHAPEHALREVPDPYFGGDEGFAEVFDMLTEACTNLIADVRK